MVFFVKFKFIVEPRYELMMFYIFSRGFILGLITQTLKLSDYPY